MTKQRLISENDDPRVGDCIESAAKGLGWLAGDKEPSTFFEHGQWWLDCGFDEEDDLRVIYSVVDSDSSCCGFKYRGRYRHVDFERVS